MIRFSATKKQFTIEEQDGKFLSLLKRTKLVLHGFTATQKIKVNGRTSECQAEINSFFLPLEKFDPIDDPDSMGEEDVMVLTFDYSSDRIELTW